MIINPKKNIGLVFEAAVAYLSRESWQQCPWQRLKKRTRAKCPNQAPARRFVARIIFRSMKHVNAQ